MQCSSAYAEQLAKGPSAPFTPELTLEFRIAHLRRIKNRARVWFSFSTINCLAFTLLNAHKFGLASPITLLHLFILLPCCATILYICWSRVYENAYLRYVPYLYSAVIIFISGSVAEQMSAGELDAIGQLICNIFAVFFFVNLSWRQALFLACLSLASFSAFCLWASIDLAVILRCETHVLVAVVGASVIYFDVERTNRKRFLDESLLTHLATRDGLSGLSNRRAFDDHLTRLWAQGMRDRSPIVLLLLDVDHFKRFNDNYGHQAGDNELRRVAGVIQQFSLRPLDLAARYGGEEFALLLFGFTTEHALEFAEQLRNRVKMAAAPEADAPRSTVSVGIAIGMPTLGRSPAGLIQLADEALYQAKQDGRDRCVLKGFVEHEQLKTGAFQRKTSHMR